MIRTTLRVVVAALLLLRCGGGSVDLAILRPDVPEIFEREPYLVSTSENSAVLRWTTRTPIETRLRYWVDADTIEIGSGTGITHTVEMNGLQPATAHTYQVSIGDALWARAVTFRTAPEPGTNAPISFLVFGDSGMLNEPQLALARHMNEEHPDLILHVGDIAYADGMREDFTRKHFNVYAPLLGRSPMYPAVGDHDLRTEGGAPYLEAFDPPGGRPSGSPWYYAVTYGNARFISLDTKDDEDHVATIGYIGDPAGGQRQWLLEELEATRTNDAIDWIIVYFHHTPYSASTGFGGHGSDLPLRQALAPLFDEYGVQFAFYGHDHDYQRSRPIRENAIVNDGMGTVYIVTGGGGGRWTFRGTGADWFTAYSEQIHQYVRATIDGYTIRVEAVNSDGIVFDQYELTLPEARR